MADLDGRWVTMNGARVFISSKGDVVMGLGKAKRDAQDFVNNKVGDSLKAERGQDIQEVLSSIYEEYPELANLNNDTLGYMRLDKTEDSDLTCWYDSERGAILVYNTSDDNGDAGWMAVKSFKGSITHEMGHVADEYASSRLSQDKFNTSGDAVNKAYLKAIEKQYTSREDFYGKLSSYAKDSSSSSEAFAEAFTLHILSPGSNETAELIMSNWKKK